MSLSVRPAAGLLAAASSVLLAAACASAPSADVGTAAAASAGMPATLPLKLAPRPTSPDITPADLMTRLYIFADDSMMGREAGTIGNVRGTDYIAAEARRLGLRPAGDGGTYFQTIPFKVRSVDRGSVMVVGGAGNGARLAYGTDWGATGNTSVSVQNAPVVYGGALGDSTARLTAEQTAGRIVVLGAPTGGGMRALRRLFGGASPYPNAAAVLVAAGTPQIIGYLARPSQFMDDPSNAGPSGGPPTIFLAPGAVAGLFDGDLASLRAGAAGRPLSLDLRVTVAPVPAPARNVVAILPGRDPKLAGEYVAVGAHNDHVGFNTRPVDHDSLRIYNHLVRPGGAEDSQKQATPEQQAQINRDLAAWRAAHPGAARLDSIYNGADDDGSGSVSVLEIAERLATLKGDDRPRRSILFVWHVGEEKGLLGAEYYTDHPTVPRDSIVAQLNIDMVGRGAATDVTGQTKEGAPLRGGPDYVQLFGSRRLSTELGDIVEQANAGAGLGLRFDYAMDVNGHPMNIYCRSDHYEYARYGIPITFFTTGGHSDYHQVTDEPQYIDYAHMARVDRLIAASARRVADLDHRVVVDKPKPDPHGSCQQ